MLEGDLTDFTLPDVLRLLTFTTKTGELRVRAGDVTGRVDLVEGRLRGASADVARLPLARRALGAGVVDEEVLVDALAGWDTVPTDLQLARRLVTAGAVDAADLVPVLRDQTTDAVFDLVRWPEGRFRFTVSDAEVPGPTAIDLALPVDEVLDDVARRLEAWAALADRTGPLDAVVHPRRPPGEVVEVSLPGDAWALLALVDGRRSLAELVDLAGQGEHRTRRTLGALLDEHLVAIGDGADRTATDRLLAAHAAVSEREQELAASSPGATTPGPPVPAASVAPATAVTPATPVTTVTPVTPATPEPTVVAAPPPEPAPATDPDEEPDDAGHGPLRTQVRGERLRTDPAVDEDLVTRLIEGVEQL